MQAEIDLYSAVPPWENGGLLAEAKRVLEEQDEGALMGNPRFEQLAWAHGTLKIGNEEHCIDGGALRIRRRGVRRLATFWGHAWQSALFPSGRAFGYITYPPREDGLPTYNEGFVFEGDGELIPPGWSRPHGSSGSTTTVTTCRWLSRQSRGSRRSKLKRSCRGSWLWAVLAGN